MHYPNDTLVDKRETRDEIVLNRLRSAVTITSTNNNRLSNLCVRFNGTTIGDSSGPSAPTPTGFYNTISHLLDELFSLNEDLSKHISELER